MKNKRSQFLLIVGLLGFFAACSNKCPTSLKDDFKKVYLMQSTTKVEGQKALKACNDFVEKYRKSDRCEMISDSSKEFQLEKAKSHCKVLEAKIPTLP